MARRMIRTNRQKGKVNKSGQQNQIRVISLSNGIYIRRKVAFRELVGDERCDA